jgi:hypothetical protein
MPRKHTSTTKRSGPAKRSATGSHDAALRELRAFGLSYPKAHTKSPWPGHLDLAVNDKTFAYLGVEGEPFSIGCKLPHSCAMALNLPYTQPTPYGLGKSGWVSATPPAGKPIPMDLFKAWIDESYRAQAPKRLVAQLPPSASGAVESGAVEAAAVRPGKRAAAQPAGRKPSQRK